MIKSMTGFGRCEYQQDEQKFIVEMKSVNHRYFDTTIKMPKKFNFFEASIRNLLKEYIQRGKIDVFITYEDYSETKASLTYNEKIAGEYLQYFKQMAQSFQLTNDISVSQLGRCPEVFTMEEAAIDEKELWSILEKALRGACEQFVETRAKEGENLKTDLIEKLNVMEGNVDLIIERYPEIMKNYREKLEIKIKEILGDAQIEETRIASELVLYADKICTDEETVRLKSHIANMKQTLETGIGIGRKLDFIAQEMNREANTIMSKANDLTTSNIGIELKTDIEKVREQIQNIE